jgi:hypothetical protein
MTKMSIRAGVAALAAVAALAVGGQVSSASAASFPGFAFPGFPASSFTTPVFAGAGFGVGTGANSVVPGPCATASPFDGQGRVGGINNQICMGAGLAFVGPSVGQIASVIGPTIIGPAVVGVLIVSAGNVSVG